MKDALKNNPAIIIGAITAVLSALVAFGVPLTEAQQTALIGLAPLLAGLVTRQFVYGPVTVEKMQAKTEAVQQ